MRDILYIDTESDPDTKALQCITLLFNGESHIIDEFTPDTYKVVKSLFDSSAAVVMFNAPYDLGVLSAAYAGSNSYKWVELKDSAYWDLIIFQHRYQVRKISPYRNLIKPLNRVDKNPGKTGKRKTRGVKSSPVIDLLKLWSILIDDGSKGSISLKSLIKRELGKDPIEWSADAALTTEYRLQDVVCLEELFHIFLDRVKDIEFLKDYSWSDWAYIKTPATFTKLEYQKAYPDLKSWKQHNDDVVSSMGLSEALESSYHGGITISMRRGVVDKTAWVDISSAYANTIKHLNTDRYMLFDLEEVPVPDDLLTNKTDPYLLQVECNFLMASVNNSLKLFAVETPVLTWLWSFDLQALSLLYKPFTFKVVRCILPVPQNTVASSRVTEWVRMKEDEEKTHGKTTRREFLKFLSNTSYGIKAQRKPFTTTHTNMVIAGIITSRAHLILAEIIDEVEKTGYRNEYNDTDSCCMSYSGEFDLSLVDRINTRIAPFTVECEGYDMKTKFLSLKRYISEGGKLTSGKAAKSKIRLHGKGRFNVSAKDIYEYVTEKKIPGKRLVINQMSANTKRTMDIILSRYPFIDSNKHPFMFVRNVRTDVTMKEFFARWYNHIDTKTTFPKGGRADEEFKRDYHVFSSLQSAYRFFGAHLPDEERPDDLTGASFIDWDAEAAFLFFSGP